MENVKEDIIKEREDLIAWINDFQEKQNQLLQIQARLAYINGWLARDSEE